MTKKEDPTSIGSLLVDLGFCTRNEIDAALKRSNGLGIGETLEVMGVITPRQLEWALVYQRQQRGEASSEEVAKFARDQRAALVDEAGDVACSARNLASCVVK